MKLPANSDMLFSLKCFIASMLALYIASRLALPRPFWAMMTAYIVANPLAGAVRSKALYRIGGTFLGSTATLIIVPHLINSPELLSLALALWVGFCLYMSLLDRTPRSYVFMLSGYTAALIAFPVVTDPLTLFDVGLARVEEICIGITCATLVHSLVLPQSLGPVLLARVDKAIGDVRRWIEDAMSAPESSQTTHDRKTLASDLTEMRVMATHLPFDTSQLRWMSHSISSLQDKLTLLVPTISSIENRLRALRAHGSAYTLTQYQAVLARINTWIQKDAARDTEHSHVLNAEIKALTPAIHAQSSWADILLLNLCTQLHTLLNTYGDVHALRENIGRVARGEKPVNLGRQTRLSTSVLHRDHAIALRSALAAVLTITVCCAFWIFTGWSNGAAAPMMGAIFCCLFATQDNPVPGMKIFIKFMYISIPISAFYMLVALPAVHSFTMMVAVIAPLFLFIGCYLARPATTLPALSLILGVAGALSMQDTNTFSLVYFIDGTLAQILGISIAVFFTRLLRIFSAQWTARRLLHAGWKELSLIATAEQTPSLTEMTTRTLDRIALLTPRLAMSGLPNETYANDALLDLRIGLRMVQLRQIASELDTHAISLTPLMTKLAIHFKHQDADKGYTFDKDSTALLHTIDEVLQAACAVPHLVAVSTLASLRQDLFPDAPAYIPQPNLQKAAS